jgi:hypothetical protein
VHQNSCLNLLITVVIFLRRSAQRIRILWYRGLPYHFPMAEPTDCLLDLSFSVTSKTNPPCALSLCWLLPPGLVLFLILYQLVGYCGLIYLLCPFCWLYQSLTVVCRWCCLYRFTGCWFGLTCCYTHYPYQTLSIPN